MSFSFLVIEISVKFLEIKYCTFPELVKGHFILRKIYIGYILRNYLTQNVCNMKKTWKDINALIHQ